MKKKSVFLLGLVGLAQGLILPQAEACSMNPINREQQVEEMEPFGAAALKLKSEEITSVSVSDVTASDLWGQSPMCPIGIRASAVFTVHFNNPSDPLSSGCTGVVKVIKKEVSPNNLPNNEVPRQYTVEVMQGRTCLESVEK